MKNKNLVIIIIIIGILVLVGLGVFIFLGKKNVAAPVVQVPPEEVISTMKPEDIGLSLTTSSDSHKVILEIANTTNISKLDYELNYTKKGDIPTGVIGTPQIKSGQAFRQEIVLGTCSDVCHYDEDVSNIKLILKVTKTDGAAGQIIQTLD